MKESKSSQTRQTMSDDTEAQGAGARVIRLLQAVAESTRELSLKELAERLELPPSTVHRLLQLLVKTEMVERADAQTYRPGRQFLRSAAHVLHNFSPAEVARPFVNQLWEEWQETCSFCVYRPAIRAAMVAETRASPHPLQIVMEAFDPVSLLWGSLGRAILAHLPDKVIATMLADASPGPITGRQAPDRGDLLDEIGLIRRRGYALYEDRQYLDLAGLAAPVLGPAGLVIGSLGVIMPATRFDRPDKEKLAQSVLAQARLLSVTLGFEG